VRFVANDALVDTERRGNLAAASSQEASSPAAPALDFIRGRLGLVGTKEGCREGDCGACAVIVGERRHSGGSKAASFSYRAQPSCLLALGELEGRHLVTIEGLAAAAKLALAAKGGAAEPARPALTPVMAALAEANGSQCGFCSPGFVISLTAYLLNGDPGSKGALSVEGAVAAVEGNLCRCTGYASIKRAAERLVSEFAGLPAEPEARLAALVEAAVLPRSCLDFVSGTLIHEEAVSLNASIGNVTTGPSSARQNVMGDAPPTVVGSSPPIFIGGGSDYFVRNPDPEPGTSLVLLDRIPELKRIARENGCVLFGAALNWREFFASNELREIAPGVEAYERLLASPLVRERATVGGNIANASPVGDLTSMLIALGALVRLTRLSDLSADMAAGANAARKTRELPLEKLFLGYKRLELDPGEIIEAVVLPAAKKNARFSFEKLSKREKLDIAAVNSAAFFEIGDRNRITRARVSAGGVAATPLLLAQVSAYLEGKAVDAAVAAEAARLAGAEAKPIGDVRGSADYRRRGLERLVIAHLMRAFPGAGCEEALK
jgi:Xanthine dehydrogenase, iron-sulfur cluster and FAD-binding subunit A